MKLQKRLKCFRLYWAILFCFSCSSESDLRCKNVASSSKVTNFKIFRDEDTLSKLKYFKKERDYKLAIKLRDEGKKVTINKIPFMNVETMPTIAAKIESGWLIGSDRGEWKGELIYRSEKYGDYLLLQDNIRFIKKVGVEYYIFTGLAHLVSNKGDIHIVRINKNIPEIEHLHELPAKPVNVCMIGDKRVLLELSYDQAFILERKQLREIRSPTNTEMTQVVESFIAEMLE